jgi:hypothetical protein
LVYVQYFPVTESNLQVKFISLSLSQSDHIRRLPRYLKSIFFALYDTCMQLQYFFIRNTLRSLKPWNIKHRNPFIVANFYFMLIYFSFLSHFWFEAKVLFFARGIVKRCCFAHKQKTIYYKVIYFYIFFLLFWQRPFWREIIYFSKFLLQG